MVWNDLRYALRLMRRSPGFTAAAVLSLALGIGANTAIFSLLNTILLRPLPVERPEELVELMQQYPGEPRGNGYWSGRSYEHFREHSKVFSALTSTGFDNLMRLRAEGLDTQTVAGENVRGNYFSFLGLKPAAGRLIGPEDAPPNGSDGDVIVLSWSFWNSRFNRDPAIIGKRIYVGDAPRTVIGIAPQDYSGPRLGVRTDVWIPNDKGAGVILARLRSGATIAQARAEMSVLFRFTIEERAAASQDSLVRQLKVFVEPAGSGLSRVRDQYAKPLLLLMAVVGLLLLLACMNTATLLLARGAGRQREMAVRLGLGASRGQLVRQTLTEALLLSCMGTAAGTVLAWFGAGVLVRIMSSGRLHERISLDVTLDSNVLLFAIGMALATGLLFGIAPAWHAIRATPADRLRHAGKAAEPREWRLFARALVAGQVGLSILLVTGAFVFLSHVSHLRNFDLGFRSDHVLLVQLDPQGSGYRREQLAQGYQQLLERLRSAPGVRSVSITGCTPIQGCGASRFVTAEGFVERPEERRFTALSWVAPSYFESLRIPLIAGRDFSVLDAARSRVAIISQSMARHYFAGANPIGQRLRIDRDPRTGGWYGTDEPYEVVGVVGDIKYTELREPPNRTMYLNMFQEGRVVHQLVLRTSLEPGALGSEVRRSVSEILKTVPVTRVTTLEEQVDSAIVPERLIATLSSYFGVLGAVLAAIGMYGLLAYAISRRTSEIGVRMALGATSGRIVRMVFRDALSMVVAGLGLGVVLVIWSGPLAARLVEGLSRPGAAPISSGAAAIIGIALLAAGIPARRASRVNPLEALRHD